MRSCDLIPSHQREQAFEQDHGARRTAGDDEIDWHDARRPAGDRVTARKDAAVRRTGATRNDPFGRRRRGISAFQRLTHVQRDRPGHQKNVGMPERRRRRRLSNERGSVRAEIGFRSPPWLKAGSQHFGGDFSWVVTVLPLRCIAPAVSVAGLASRRDVVAISLGKFDTLDIVAWTSSQRRQRSDVLEHRLNSAGEQCDTAHVVGDAPTSIQP